MTSELDALKLRLARLEQSSLRWRRIAAVLCGGWLVFLAVAATPADRQQDPEEITVHKLRLVDEHGKVRAELSVDEDGRGGLYVFDPTGKVRAEVSTDEQASAMMLRDIGGQNRLGLAVDQYPHLMLYDGHQVPRLHASVGITNAPSLVMIDDHGTFAAGMGLNAKGKPWITPLLPMEGDESKPTQKKDEDSKGR